MVPSVCLWELMHNKHAHCPVGHSLQKTCKAIFFWKLHNSLGGRQARSPHFTVRKTELRKSRETSFEHGTSERQSRPPAQHSQHLGGSLDPTGTDTPKPLPQVRKWLQNTTATCRYEHGGQGTLKAGDTEGQRWDWGQTACRPSEPFQEETPDHQTPGDAASLAGLQGCARDVGTFGAQDARTTPGAIATAVPFRRCP